MTDRPHPDDATDTPPQGDELLGDPPARAVDPDADRPRLDDESDTPPHGDKLLG